MIEEKIIKVKDKEYFLIPDFRNIKRLEIRLGGEKVLATAKRLVNQDYGPYDIVDIIYCFIDESEKVDYDKLAKGIEEEGWYSFSSILIELFTDMLNRGSKEVKENPQVNKPK